MYLGMHVLFTWISTECSVSKQNQQEQQQKNVQCLNCKVDDMWKTENGQQNLEKDEQHQGTSLKF